MSISPWRGRWPVIFHLRKLLSFAVNFFSFQNLYRTSGSSGGFGKLFKSPLQVPTMDHMIIGPCGGVVIGRQRELTSEL